MTSLLQLIPYSSQSMNTNRSMVNVPQQLHSASNEVTSFGPHLISLTYEYVQKHCWPSTITGHCLMTAPTHEKIHVKSKFTNTFAGVIQTSVILKLLILVHRFSTKDRDKAEQELAISVKKAVSLDETAPKQKHVRGDSYNNDT